MLLMRPWTTETGRARRYRAGGSLLSVWNMTRAESGRATPDSEVTQGTTPEEETKLARELPQELHEVGPDRRVLDLGELPTPESRSTFSPQSAMNTQVVSPGRGFRAQFASSGSQRS